MRELVYPVVPCDLLPKMSNFDVLEMVALLKRKSSDEYGSNVVWVFNTHFSTKNISRQLCSEMDLYVFTMILVCNLLVDIFL